MDSPQSVLHRWASELKKSTSIQSLEQLEDDGSTSSSATDTAGGESAHFKSKSNCSDTDSRANEGDNDAPIMMPMRAQRISSGGHSTPPSAEAEAWTRELIEFCNSGDVKRTMLTPVTTRAEERAARAACAARGLHAQEAGRYNVRLVLGEAGGLCSVVVDEAGRGAGETSSEELTRPKFFRVARHRAACIGPLFAPLSNTSGLYGPVATASRRAQACEATLANFMHMWSPSDEWMQIVLKRETALVILRLLVREWVAAETKAHRFKLTDGDGEGDDDDDDCPEDPGGAVFLSGSTCFVVDAVSDVDAVCVVPRQVSRESFFSTFLDRLAQHPSVSDILPVSSAQVPMIHVNVNGVAIDLLLARLGFANEVSGTLDVSDDEVLDSMDPVSSISLSGPRNADMIRWLVPNVDNFTGTLTLVRFWARRRGLYSSKLGYLGGVSYAVLVAAITQLFPNAAPGAAFACFFDIFARWDWARHPVRICDNGGESWRRHRAGGGSFSLSPAVFSSSSNDGPAPLLAGRVSSCVSLSSAFSATTLSDAEDNHPALRSQHLMPIITPASPPTDSAASVTHSTRTTLLMEFARGRSLMRGFSLADSEAERQAALYELFLPYTVFDEFPTHVVLELRASSVEEWGAWLAFVESRLRKLTTLLEGVPCVERVRIEPDCRAHGKAAGCFYTGIAKNAAAKAALAVSYASVSVEHNEAIERTVAFFIATHIDSWADKAPGMRMDFHVMYSPAATSASWAAPCEEDGVVTPAIEYLNSGVLPPRPGRHRTRKFRKHRTPRETRVRGSGAFSSPPPSPDTASLPEAED